MKQVSAYLLYDINNRILLMLRTTDASTHPDYWGFFGGKIEKDETPEMAVKREAREELGINLEKIKLFKTYIQEDSYGKQVRYIFIGPLEHQPDKLRDNQSEGQDLDLFSLEDLKNIKISRNDLDIIKEVVKKI